MKKQKIALITGISGQDGSYLAELLLKKKYKVFGIIRKQQNISSLKNLDFIKSRIKFLKGDAGDKKFIAKIIKNLSPDEVYHLAAQSNVGKSFESAIQTLHFNIESTYTLLEAIKNFSPNCRFYFAGTSEMFGLTRISPQNEKTPFNPISPYGVSKVACFYIVKMFREAYGIFACVGILFNHESPRRGEGFVTKKIVKAVSSIKKGSQKSLSLGNIDIKRDWGFAEDYVNAMWRMLQNKKAMDYVIGTGESHSLQEFLEIAFSEAGLDWKEHVLIDRKLFRPLDIKSVVANNSKAKKDLKWKPRTKFVDLVKLMVNSEIEKWKK